MNVTTLNCGGRLLDLQYPIVMGILNLTPDSFSDGGNWVDPGAALDHALAMVEAGAHIIDVGGESTRPGASAVSASEEMDRIVPVIESLTKHAGVPLSVDTSKPEVMRAAVRAGAGMVNDVFALRQAGAVNAVAELAVPVCLMHMQGTPGSMQSRPEYDDVVSEVQSFLLERAAACRSGGIEDGRIIIDAGFGFGKTLEHNIQLFSAIPLLAKSGYPLLVGVSRKSMLGQITGQIARGGMEDRLVPSVVAAVKAVSLGASIVRVHDVTETVVALKVFSALQ